MSQVARPADFFVTIDEHPDSINDGYFLNNPGGAGPGATDRLRTTTALAD